MSNLLYLSVLRSTATVLAPKPIGVAGKFLELSHFCVEDAQPPSGQGIQGKSYLQPFLPLSGLWEWKLHVETVRFEGHDRECHLLKDK